MTSEAILSLLDHLCNEARNAMHAAFGLMEFRPDPASGPAWQICLDASRSSADRLLRTLDDMRALVSEQVPAGESLDEIDLTLCVGEISDLLNLASGDRVAKLMVESGEELIRIRQNRDALEQLLARILKLALKLSRTGVIRIAVSASEDCARLAIVAPGSDVARQLADGLNADPGHVKFDGEDIGALVSVLVAGRRLRALGGAAELECDSGVPTVLAIYLPRQLAGVEDQFFGPAEVTKPLRVLVAEDSDDSYALTELLLRNESVDRARTGLEAIDKVKRRRFDVVLMDVHMPGMDGYESIRTIRNWETQSGNARTPIVVLSSDDIGTQTRGAAQSGCSGYLRKPVRQSDLVDLLEPLRATRDLMV